MDNSERVEVSAKGSKPTSEAINYLLLGHHARSAGDDPILLAKKCDGSFFFSQGCGMSDMVRRDTGESFNHQDDPVPSAAFTYQLEQLDQVYKEIDLTPPPRAPAYNSHHVRPASQERSEATLDRGERN